MIKSIKKLFFTSLTLVYFLGLSLTTAMEEITDTDNNINSSISINIGHITPVRDGMSKEEAGEAIQYFLQSEVFKPENKIKQGNITSDRTKTIGNRDHRFITLSDGTEWVGSQEGLQRFLGAIYLKKALENHNLDKSWCAVETKFILKDEAGTITIKVKRSQDDPLKNVFTINSDNFISFSRYVGDQKPTKDDLHRLGLDFSSKYGMGHVTGYFDFGENANLRIQNQDNKITVIDTEYSSFKNNDKVKPPSQKTELDIGDASFTFLMKSFNFS